MLINDLSEKVKDVFTKIGYIDNDENTVYLVDSDRPDLSDLQCNLSLKLCKQYKKSPQEIAKQFVSELQKDKELNQIFSNVSVAGPGFINFSLSDEYINSKLNKMMIEPKFGIKPTNKKVVLDFGGPNVAKPLHVGHLRSAIVGESIKHIMQYSGDSVISDIHLGDFGLQIGQVIEGIRRSGKDIEEISIDDLDKIYPLLSAECKDNPETQAICAQITAELQSGNISYRKIWKKIMQLSKKDIKSQYDYLGVSWDLWKGESDCFKTCVKLEKELREKGYLEKSEGAEIIRTCDDNSQPPLIYKNSRGAYMYGTTDLATLKDRMDEFNPDEIVYVVDKRQSLHFDQVFEAARRTKIVPPTTQLTFCGFGTVNGTDGKPFKTRKGDAPKLTSLFKQIKDMLREKEQNANATDEDLDKLVNATIKFADLQNSRDYDYIFDIEKFSNTTGRTGPYLLYTNARLISILKNELFDKKEISSPIYNEQDRDLRLQLLKFQEVFDRAYREKKPNILGEYVFGICEKANAFYQVNKVKGNLNLIQKNNWCNLLSMAIKMITDVSELLTIKQPRSMDKKAKSK